MPGSRACTASPSQAGDPPRSPILCLHNSTATPSSFPRRGHWWGGGGGQGKQAEGLLEEAQFPTGPEGQTPLEAQPELPGSRPWVSRAAGSTLPNPSSQPPALPARLFLGPAHSTHVWAERVRAARWAQARQLGPGKPAGCKASATVRPQRGLFFSPRHFSCQQTEPPPEFTKTNAPTVGSAQAETELPQQAGLQAQTPSPASHESCDPVISGGPGMCSILGPSGL